MLEPEYAKLEDIPAEKRGAYIQKDGKYVLDDLSDKHPLLVEKKTIERDLTTERGKVTKLTNEKTQLEARPALPDGHVAVPAADKEFIDKLKPLGPADQTVTRLREADTIKNEQHLRDVEKVMGWKEGSLKLVPNLPTLEIRDVTENGQPVKDDKGNVKKTVIAKLEGADKVVTEKPFKEHFDSTPALKGYEPLLLRSDADQGSKGTELPEFGSSGGGADVKNLAGSLIASRYGHNAPKADAATK